jgi:proteasome lid subunit RPN8/RPN11
MSGNAAHPARPTTSPAPRAGLRIPASVMRAMSDHARACVPLEACGLLVGELGGDEIREFHPCGNAAASARLYTVEPRDHLRVERDAEARGLAVVGVMHSHTHTEPYPSATDVRDAPDPAWHYVIVGLKRGIPDARAYRIVGETITETAILPAR